MRKPTTPLRAVTALAFVLASGIFANAASAEDAPNPIAEGKKAALDRQKGNCLSCHAIEGGELPGNIGPPLVNMKERFPDKEQLKKQIWDATKNNPNSIMPPFGRFGVLSEQELNNVVEYIHSL